MDKAKITFNGVPLAANSSVVWRFQTGTQPFTSVFSVHKTDWNKIRGLLGQEGDLEITDARGVSTRIKKLSPLYQVPSDSAYRVSFLVADKRWKWAYKLVARDYNIPKKTGDRTIVGGVAQNVPVELQVTVDEYDYRPYSLNDGKRWTAREAVEDVLELLNGRRDRRGGFTIESFPINADDESGQHSLQNIMLRDQGDVALARLLSYIPGAEVYVDADGVARVIDAADLTATKSFLEGLPPETRDGERSAFVDRSKIRPKRVVVHYQREVELLCEYQDDFNATTSEWRTRQKPYLDNVIPTVDPSTVLSSEYDPETETTITKTVAQGTWVELPNWLRAMDADKPTDSLPWTFETIREFWIRGGLEGVLGGGQKVPDDLETGNATARVAALREHMRQTFRINRSIMERVRDVMDVRAATLDPITGARAPASVWNQYCIDPSQKGKHMVSRTDAGKNGMFRNVDALADSESDGERIINTTPGAAEVVFRDKDLGIFRVETVQSPFGTDASIIPCHVVTERNQGVPYVPVYDLSKQDEDPIGPGMRVEGTTAGVQLRKTMKLKALITIVPAAPNNPKQFHREYVEANDIAELFAGEYGITEGSGPDLEVFVPPNEVTARFAWYDDEQAEATIKDLLGLDRITLPNEAGVEGPDLPGFEFANYERSVKPHARAVAAEMLAAFADNVQGSVSTILPDGGVRVVGNMAGASIVASGAPSGKVMAVHDFPGQQKPISRFSMLPNAARLYILGIVAYKASR